MKYRRAPSTITTRRSGAFGSRRLSGSFEYYKSNTTDLLVDRKIPTVLGYSNIPANLGEIRNKVGLKVPAGEAGGIGGGAASPGGPPYPFTTAIGRSRATTALSPASATASTTKKL